MKVEDIALEPGIILHQKYQIDEIYYWGQTGISYLCTDTFEEKKLVIKECCPHKFVNRDLDHKTLVGKNQSGTRYFKEVKETFKEECSIVKKVSGLKKPYPGCTPEYMEEFSENGSYYLVTRYITGEGLDHYLNNEGRYSEKECMLDIVRIVKQIHKKGVLHRDIKPSNILIRPDGKAVLIDFGSACYMNKNSENTRLKYVSNGFSAPELYQGRPTDRRTDIYSIGALFYNILTKYQLPAASEISEEEPIPAISEITPISPRLERAVMHSLELEPQKRTKHLEELELLLKLS